MLEENSVRRSDRAVYFSVPSIYFAIRAGVVSWFVVLGMLAGSMFRSCRIVLACSAGVRFNLCIILLFISFVFFDLETDCNLICIKRKIKIIKSHLVLQNIDNWFICLDFKMKH